MTFKIWFRIFVIVFLVSMPLAIVQYFLQKESIELVLEIASKTTPTSILDRQMQLLKQISKIDTKNVDQYKKEFESVVEIKIAKEELSTVKVQLIKNLLRQTLHNIICVLMIFLVLTFIVSKQIVVIFKKVLDQLQAQSNRLERLNSIEKWQKLVRVLVHELRAPVTPIKLVSTDIEYKYRTLPSHVFKEYLREGASLIQNEVASIEKLLESFTLFAKLPEIKKQPVRICDFLEMFIKNYANYNHGQAEISLILGKVVQEEILVDPEALKHLFFNLLKNASESNKNNNIKIFINLNQNEKKTWIRFKNTGKEIPKEVSDKLFELYFSTKKQMESLNFGMGLTISKKIALDHGGDLYLVSGETDNVTFELEVLNI